MATGADKITAADVGLRAEVERLRAENATLRQRDNDLVHYLRGKIDQLLGVVGTLPLRAEELDEDGIIAFDPIGIISDSFVQVLHTLQETNDHLRLARDEIAATYNAVGAGIVVLDRKQRILSFNRRLKEIFFPGKKGIIGHTCVSLMCREKTPASGCVFAKVMASGQREATQEWAFNQHYFDVVGMPVKDRQGKVQQVVIVYHEVTERKQGEEELCRALNQAVEAQQNIAAIVSSVYEGMLVTDPAGTLLLANPAALGMLPLPAEKVVGLTLQQLFSDSELAMRWQQAVQQNNAGEPFDYHLQGREGGSRCYQVRMALLHAADGTVRGGVLTLRDVTVERELEKMKSEFVSTAAHELRTPLTSILGFAELLQDSKTFSLQERSEFAALIHDKAEKLSELIDELLDISRIEAGQVIPLARQAVALGPLVETSLNFFRYSSPRHQFKLLMPAAPLTVYADPRRIGQVLDNLLSNAVKYSPEGGSISVQLDAATEHCTISVSDEGIGMSSEQIERIFDKFYRVDASTTAVQGVGLGMTIVRDLIESHGSEITVKSAPGQGTTISFTLPFLPEGHS
ncbi:MAG: PAS domain-containing protein [Desulfuromonadales bacterium]|nr:PAS domain-containing protein [Desulfuromonadales bacterium]